MAKKKVAEVELTKEELAANETKKAKERVSKKLKDIQDATEPEGMTFATVANCERLNVRKSPRTDASIVQVLDKGASVRVFQDQDTANFYKVITVNGVVGFCMKKYIKLKK